MIDDGFVIVNVYKVVFVLYNKNFHYTKLQHYQRQQKASIISHSYDTSTTYHQPLIVPSACTHQPLTVTSASHHPPLNKTVTINNFGMLLFIEDSTVVYLFSDVGLHVIDCLLHTTAIIAFKLVRISLKTTLSMAKQLQYCCKVCNMKQYWILWNHSLDESITTMFVIITYDNFATIYIKHSSCIKWMI